MARETIRERRKLDRERMAAFRAEKEAAKKTGTATPDARDLAYAAAEALRRFLLREERVRERKAQGIVSIGMRPLDAMLGCLIRDGFDEDKSRRKMEVWLESDIGGPTPLLFLRGFDRDQVWADWNRREAARSADRSNQSVATLANLDGKTPS